MAFSRMTRRGRRYWVLRKARMVPIEAREFSKLNQRYPALKKIVQEREYLFQAFKLEARAKGWESEHKRKVEWARRIGEFYSMIRAKIKRDKTTGASVETLTRWVVRKDVHGRPIRPTISPWEYYDFTFNQLPDELKWDTPRSRRSPQPDVDISVVVKQRWVHDLNKQILATIDPARKRQLTQQRDNLIRSMKTRR